MPVSAPNTTDACTMAPSLAAMLAIHNSHWPECSIDHGPLETGWRTLAQVFEDPVAMEGLLAAQAELTAGLDRKGQAAYLVGYHAYFLSLPAAVGLVATGIVPNLAAERTAVRFEQHVHDDEDHAHLHFHFRLLDGICRGDAPGDAAAPQDFARRETGSLSDVLRVELEANFEPLIERLHAMTRLSRNALWRQAADSVAFAFLEVGRDLNREDEAKAAAMAVLKAPGSPFSNPQLQFVKVVVPDVVAARSASRTYASRGGCCRYYTAPGGSVCANCVLQRPDDRDRLLAEHLREHLTGVHAA